MRHLIKYAIILSLICVNMSVSKAESAMVAEHVFPTLHIVKHPLIQHKLTIMRDENTKMQAFRDALAEIAMLMGYDVTKSLQTKDRPIKTPVAKMIGQQLTNDVVIVPILRAGLGMAVGMQKLIPGASVGHIGLARNPKNPKDQPIEYLFKMPKIKNQIFIIVDPMLATGGSAIYAVNKLVKAGVPQQNIIFMALVVAPEGMTKFAMIYPNIPVYAAALDKALNSHSYIVPGLGDAGDRLYGTE